MRSPDVVFGCEDKLIVENPLWFVVKAGAWVKLDNLEVSGPMWQFESSTIPD